MKRRIRAIATVPDPGAVAGTAASDDTMSGRFCGSEQREVGGILERNDIVGGLGRRRATPSGLTPMERTGKRHAPGGPVGSEHRFMRRNRFGTATIRD